MKNLVRSCTAPIVVVLVFLAPMTVSGVDNVDRKWDPQQYGIYNYSPCYVFEPDFPTGSIRTRISEARTKWNNAQSEFYIRNASGCVREIQIDRDDLLVPFNEVWAYVANDQFGDISYSTINFNASPDCGSECVRGWYYGTGTPGSNQGDMLSIALHEFGHTVALNDLSYCCDVMYGHINAQQTRRWLQSHDYYSIYARYGIAQ